jgi:hypothetical protein
MCDDTLLGKVGQKFDQKFDRDELQFLPIVCDVRLQSVQFVPVEFPGANFRGAIDTPPGAGG